MTKKFPHFSAANSGRFNFLSFLPSQQIWRGLSKTMRVENASKRESPLMGGGSLISSLLPAHARALHNWELAISRANYGTGATIFQKWEKKVTLFVDRKLGKNGKRRTLIRRKKMKRGTQFCFVWSLFHVLIAGDSSNNPIIGRREPRSPNILHLIERDFSALF